MSMMHKWKGLLCGTVLACTAFVSESAAQNCLGTAYIKVPETWTDLTVYYGNQANVVPATSLDPTTGFYVIDLSTIRGNDATTFIVYTGTGNIDYPGVLGINGSVYNQNFSGRPTAADIPCPGKDKPVYVTEHPETEGASYISFDPPNAKYLYVLIPEDKDWQSSLPMISFDGGVTGSNLIADSKRCGWYYAVYFGSQPVPEEVIIYRDDDPADQIGINGLWGAEEVATPIPLRQMFDSLGTNELFFIPDDAAWPDDGSTYGWYTTDNGVEGVCTYTLAAIIYDSDAAVNNLFSEYQGITGPYTETCTGVRRGVVADVLGADNKPQLNVNSQNALQCFGNDPSLFNTLFNYTPGKNEVVCYDLPFSRAKDGRWSYNSDEAVTGTTVGGFYPVENTTDESVITLGGVKQGPLMAARMKRRAEGPVDVASIPAGIANIDYVCNGPGWDGGIDCEGFFVSDDALGVSWQWDKSPTGGPRWGSSPAVSRNQHFCFESHATFTYKPGQEFTFRGDDDIWVFIAGRLAVDNGGAHLAAPGHVVLDRILDKDGKPLVAGQQYNIDIFFCDRRTTMSNVIIKTNMYIKQSTGLDIAPTGKDQSGGISYEVCWEKSGDSDCAAVAMGSGGASGGSQRYCGKEIENVLGAGVISYYITTRGGDKIADLPGGKVWYGGFDLTDPYNPVINTNKVGGLNPGAYRLVVEIQGKKTYVNFRVKGNLDIVNQTVTYQPVTGDSVSAHYPAGTKWEFVGQALAGTRVPLYVSAVADGDIDLLSAAGQNYSLTVAAGMNLYTSKDGNEVAVFPRTIGESGVDTVWASVSLAGMTAPVEVKTAQVRSIVATIEFYAPQLHFATDIVTDSTGNIASFTPVTGDPDTLDGTEYYNWVGSDVELYLLVVNPITSTVCTECNFVVDAVETSPRMEVVASEFVNGMSTVRVRSFKEYMDTTAAITMASAENPALVMVLYNNMKFRDPPVPYPTLVQLFDTKGAPAQTSLRIPTPYHEESREYLDGIADSISITYHRPFHKDSLPNFICLEWDEDKEFELKHFKFDSEKGLESSVKKDTLVTCSDSIGRAQILAAYKDRPDDSTLVFGGFEFSEKVKTAGDGKVRSWATFEDRKQVSVQSFDRVTTDRMPPVVLKARLTTNKTNKEFDDIRFVFSEPLAAEDSSKLKNMLAYYMPSATEYAVDERYASPDALQNMTLGKDSVTVSYRHLQGEKILKTPQVGDYVRFVASAVSDTAGNKPLDYDEKIPSPWYTITGDVRSIVRTINYAELDPSDPQVQKNLEDKKIVTVVLFSPYDSLGRIKDSLPYTVGHWIQTDMANLFEKYQASNPNLKPEDVVLKYEVDYFTNLGAFVANESGEIRCTDEKIFGTGESCITNPGYIYVGWNGISNDGRLVSSGAYISKMTSVLVAGKKKDAKQDQTNVFGMRRIQKK